MEEVPYRKSTKKYNFKRRKFLRLTDLRSDVNGVWSNIKISIYNTHTVFFFPRTLSGDSMSLNFRKLDSTVVSIKDAVK